MDALTRFPRLFSRGSIEARIGTLTFDLVAISAAVQPRLH